MILPGEWEKHDCTWLAWPFDESLWGSDLPGAQKEFVELCHSLVTHGGEQLKILASTELALNEAKKQLGQITNFIFQVPYGDIWLRDTAPIFSWETDGSVRSNCFKFNGWGEKYLLENDNMVSSRIARLSHLPSREHSFVLEGGSIDPDGQGTLLTTKQCLMNPNRNPSMSQKDVELALKKSLGTHKVLWLNEGLLNDHTDGHVDTIARFVSPGKAVCMRALGKSDPNFEVLEEIYTDLCEFEDYQGRRITVETIPSPGELLDRENNIMPASYVNFYIANRAVVVPIYGQKSDSMAVEKLQNIFPDKKVLGVPAKAILTGGGAFHCITQQQPSALGDVL